MVRYAARTEISSERRRQEIERTLDRYGATAFAFGKTTSPPRAQIMFELADRRMRIDLPLPDRDDRAITHTPDRGIVRSRDAQEREYEYAVRQRWAALSLWIKAQLEAIESGIVTVEDVFLSHVVLPSGATVGEWAEPQLREVYGRGEMPALLPGIGR
jgi:hypothetical protein